MSGGAYLTRTTGVRRPGWHRGVLGGEAITSTEAYTGRGRIAPASGKRLEVMALTLRESLQVSILLAIGYVLHQVTPPLMLGMKPDLLLAMVFVSVMITKKPRAAVLAGLLGGVIGALTTTFPGGQIPNIVDKFTTALVAYLLVTLLRRFDERIVAASLGLFGTLYSGAAFLGSASVLAGLPGSFGVLYVVVVLPTAALNTAVVPMLYQVVKYSRQVVAERA